MLSRILFRGARATFAVKSISRPAAFTARFGSTGNSHASDSHDHGDHGSHDHDDPNHVSRPHYLASKFLLVFCFVWILHRAKEDKGQLFVSLLHFRIFFN